MLVLLVMSLDEPFYRYRIDIDGSDPSVFQEVGIFLVPELVDIQPVPVLLVEIPLPDVQSPCRVVEHAQPVPLPVRKLAGVPIFESLFFGRIRVPNVFSFPIRVASFPVSPILPVRRA